MRENCKPAKPQLKKGPKRRRDHHALKNVVSLRISDEELSHLARIRKATSKSVSEIMRDAFNGLQRANCPCLQN